MTMNKATIHNALYQSCYKSLGKALDITMIGNIYSSQTFMWHEFKVNGYPSHLWGALIYGKVFIAEDLYEAEKISCEL